jgi:hypothetical protein
VSGPIGDGTTVCVLVIVNVSKPVDALDTGIVRPGGDIPERSCQGGPMSWAAVPPTAAWQHLEARSGFEVAWFETGDDGLVLTGCTVAVEDGRSWAVEYEIRVDRGWRTRSARVCGRSASGIRTVLLRADGRGHWLVDGDAEPHLDGCLDVDLESSAMTNALPVHRLTLQPGERAAGPAVYVRAADLGVGRLEQEYARVDEPGRRYDYAAPAFDFSSRLVYDDAGLMLEYPGIAVRAG